LRRPLKRSQRKRGKRKNLKKKAKRIKLPGGNSYKGPHRGDNCDCPKNQEVLSMCRKIVLSHIVVLAFIFFFMGIAFSQGFQEWKNIEEPSAANFFGVGTRYMGMGGVGVAFANDAYALVYNPAGLAKVKRIELALGMSHQRFGNETGRPSGSKIPVGPYFLTENKFQSNTRFGSAGLVFPVPTYRGSLVFGLGVNRVANFDKVFKYTYGLSSGELPFADELISESGGIYVWSLGGALDISPNISLGLGLNYWDGKEDYGLKRDQDYIAYGDTFTVLYDDEISDNYSGFNAKFGILIQPNKYLSFGGTLDSPVWLTIDEEYILRTDSTSASDSFFYLTEETGSPRYKLTHPYSFSFGGALNFKNLLLSGDFNYTDWSQLEYREGYRIAEKNRNVKEFYKDVFKWHIGAEYLIPQLSAQVRAGYYMDPFPFESKSLKTDRRYFSLGLGFLIDKVMTLDIAWSHGFYEFEYPNIPAIEKYRTNKIFITTAYRL
jgi:hypothetical protein